MSGRTGRVPALHRALSLLLVATTVGAFPYQPATAQDSQGTEEKTSAPLLKGEVQYRVEEGTPLKLKIASVPSHNLDLLNKDLDGNLLPARLGEEITARITEEIFVDNNKVIPEGTVFHGKVSRIYPPRRVGRPGSLEISFDRFTTPDGRSFAFHAEANNKKQSTVKTKAKGLGIIAAHAAGGAAVGVIVAYQLFGLQETITMHGYNLAAGAAGGALLATGFAIMRKGHAAVLEPGDDLNIALDTDLLMPAAVEAEKKPVVANLGGLRVKIKKTKMIKDGLEGNMLRVDCDINNNSNQLLKSIDLFLEDSNGNRYPVTGGPDDADEFIFNMEPHTQKEARLYFQVQWPKLKRTLVWINHQSRQIAFQGECP